MELINNREGEEKDRSHFMSLPKEENLDDNIEETEELVLTKHGKFSYSFKRLKEWADYDFQQVDYYSRGEWTVIDSDTKSANLHLECIEKTGGPQAFEVNLTKFSAKSPQFRYGTLHTSEAS
ncbi:hypothetical protein AKO1_002912 [Acrasis kona]|uniref:Uncharacterized protein n=1 Tax=Acrasis kona TaxID=1008807 RepID=A0AAW2YM09_9EUKA